MPSKKLAPQLEGGLASHPRQHENQPLERLLIKRVGDPFQVRGYILNVCLFKKTDTAGDGEGDIAAGKFKL